MICDLDCNGTRTHNYLVRKRTLNHLAKLAKWLSCVVSTYLCGAFDCMFLSYHVRVSEWIHTLKLWVRVSLLSLKLQISHLFRARSFLTFRVWIYSKRTTFHSFLHSFPLFNKTYHFAKNISGKRFKLVYGSWIILSSISQFLLFTHGFTTQLWAGSDDWTLAVLSIKQD